jgi:YegS/Rv2252/BmrU family lipid kinase
MRNSRRESSQTFAEVDKYRQDYTVWARLTGMGGNVLGKRALLIVNRLAREGDADLAAGTGILRERGFSLQEIYTDRAEEIPALIHQHLSETDLVIIGGGDGTLSGAIPVLMADEIPLGILPMGTANDLARTLDIPSSLAEACRVISEGRLHAIDVGQADGKYFFNVAHIGLGAHLTHQLSPPAKRRLGIAAYALALPRAIRHNRSFQAKLTCDGEEFRVRALEIAVGNGRHFGGGLTVTAEAEIDDHRLHLFILLPQPWTKLILSAWRFRRGVASQDSIQMRHGRQIRIHTAPPLPVVADGETTGLSTPLSFQVSDNALTVYVPATYRELRENRHAAE